MTKPLFFKIDKNIYNANQIICLEFISEKESYKIVFSNNLTIIVNKSDEIIDFLLSFIKV